jgi:hypothetical protein
MVRVYSYSSLDLVLLNFPCSFPAERRGDLRRAEHRVYSRLQQFEIAPMEVSCKSYGATQS